MVPAPLGKLMVLAIGTGMWIWLKAYVSLQVLFYGDGILHPPVRLEPEDFMNDSYGNHKYLNLTNVTLHYVTKGCKEYDNNQTMLLFLHGFLDFWYSWNRQIPSLGDEFCIVAPDLRGYGNSTRPEDTSQYLMLNLVEDVRGLLEKLNNDHKRKVVLVGHDWGGMISFCFATLYETLIDGMVIINGMHPKAFAKQLFQSVKQMRMSWYQLPFRHPVVPEQYLIMRDFDFFDQAHKGFTEDETYAHKYLFSRDGALTGAISYYRAFNNDSDQLGKLPYKEINVSTVILWAEEDAFIMTPIAKYNQEWLKTSKVVYYKGAGHWLPRECSTQVTEQIRKFAMNITNNTTATEEGKLESKPGTCQEASSPSQHAWLSEWFPWLPRDVKLPREMRE
ncbi:AB hydrolase superfamily protein YfhM-like [Dermacentor albipictus]|uniref:AB hydrolase superfamily protein YfhM-like n=1 Tax=Dermacentor albipictus TaxID=60249 RepID=UPI0031FCD0EA